MYWAFFSLASGQPFSRQSVREAPAELQSHGEQVQDARECSVYEMTESSANARHEGDEVESRISVTDRPRPHSRSRFLRSDSVCPDRRPTRRADADSHSQRRLLGGVELSWRRLRVLDGLPAVATRLWGNPCYSAPVRVPVVFRPRPSWPLANRRPTIHERLRAVGSHSLTSLAVAVCDGHRVSLLASDLASRLL